MAEAIFPFIVYPPEGQLPFINTARVMRGDTLIALHVPISVWPAGASASLTGMTYDHQGEAPLDFAPLFRTPNLRLFIDNLRYTIVDWEQNDYLPHVALRLREVNAML